MNRIFIKVFIRAVVMCIPVYKPFIHQELVVHTHTEKHTKKQT